MAGIYGPVTEHPEYPIRHGAPPLGWRPDSLERGPQCSTCGFRWGEDGPHR